MKVDVSTRVAEDHPPLAQPRGDSRPESVAEPHRQPAEEVPEPGGGQALDVARTFRPLSATQVQALLARTKSAAMKGEFELFKTTSIFDSTASNPDWLGEEPERIQAMVP